MRKFLEKVSVGSSYVLLSLLAIVALWMNDALELPTWFFWATAYFTVAWAGIVFLCDTYTAPTS